MPVIGGQNPTATVTVPVPTPAPMKKPKPQPQAAPQPVPANPGSPQQDVPQGMVPPVPQQPEPRAIILPWAPPPSGTPRSVMRKMRVRYAKKPGPWYSHALRVIEEKVPNRATAEQIRKTLLNNGVKPDEMKWGGVDAFLGWNPFTISADTHGPSNFINKAELLDHVRNNILKFKEKTYGTTKPRPESDRNAATEAEQQAEDALAAASRKLLSATDQIYLTNRKISDLTVSKEPFSQVRLVGNNGFRNRPTTRFDAVLYVPREVRGRLVWTKDRTLASGTPRELRNKGYEDQSYGGIHNQILTANDLQDMKEHQERQEAAKNPESQQQLEQLRQEMVRLNEERNRVTQEHQQAKKLVDAARRKRVGANKPKGTPTRYGPDSEYKGHLTIPGGTNYRETTVHLPEHLVRDADVGRAQDGGGVGREFKSGHFPGKNILYHVRYNDFNTPDGRKLLHLDEIQSDLAHASGYDHPYKKNWHELALRKVLNHAVVNGYDGISWTPGRVQADRYNLGKVVDQIQYRFGQHNPGETPATVIIRPRHSGTGKLFDEIKTSPQELHQYVGREHAARIMNGESDPSQTFTSGFGNDWSVLPISETHMGGEHHKRLYDQMIPNYLNKIGKPHGAQVESLAIREPKMNHVVEGLPQSWGYHAFATPEEAHNFINTRTEPHHRDNLSVRQEPRTGGEGLTVQHLPITPKLRQSVKQGQALYSRKMRVKRYGREHLEALEKHVQANPDDEDARQAWADELADAGDKDRANVIRNGPRSIQINGRRWFSRPYGNTYHSVQIMVDGKQVPGVPKTYGYGSHYLWTAADQLEKLGIMKGRKRLGSGGGTEGLSWWAIRHGIKFDDNVEDVRRQRDLHGPDELSAEEPQQLSRSKKYAASDDGLSMDFDSMGEDELPKEPLQRPAPKEDITGRTRKQILQQMLDAAKRGHFDPSGMTPRDYITEMEAPKDIEPGQGQVWMSDPEDELPPDDPQPPKQYNRKVTYPHLSRTV